MHMENYFPEGGALNSLSKGIYFLVLEKDNQLYSKTIIVKN